MTHTRLYSPQFPRLMAAPGDKCTQYGPRYGGGALRRCVREANHVGQNHLMDVDPRQIKPEFLPRPAPLPSGHVLKGAVA